MIDSHRDSPLTRIHPTTSQGGGYFYSTLIHSLNHERCRPRIFDRCLNHSIECDADELIWCKMKCKAFDDRRQGSDLMSRITVRVLAAVTLTMATTPIAGASLKQDQWGGDMPKIGSAPDRQGAGQATPGDSGNGPSISGGAVRSAKPSLQEKSFGDLPKAAPYTSGAGKEWPDLRKSDPVPPAKK